MQFVWKSSKCLLYGFVFIWANTGLLFGQFRADAGSLISRQTFTQHQYDDRQVSFMNNGEKTGMMDPAGIYFGSMLYIYQRVLSPHISADCIYSMSCSAFSKNAIVEYGLFKGVALSADRISRCNRLSYADAKLGDMNATFKIVDTPSKYRTTP